MADCFPAESDDLHRRWLPREIFADIGIVDTEAAAAVVTEPTSEATAAAAVEELAAQLAGILGGGAKVWPLATPPPPAAPPTAAAAAAAAPRHGAQVCGLEGSVAVSCGGTNGGGAVSWPFVPYPQLQWQIGSSLVNHGGVLDYAVLPPAPPCHVPPPPANLRGGTGVFLPRVEAYRYGPSTPPPTAKGGAWAGAAANPSWAGTGSRPATGKKQQQQPPPQAVTEHATPTKQHQKQQQQATTGAAQALALPQDWSYR